MARSAHVATATKKQARAVPYPVDASRSLGQSMPRRKLRPSVSLSKQSTGASHGSSPVSDPRMYPGLFSNFNTGFGSGINEDVDTGLPSPPTPSPVVYSELVTDSSYTHYPFFPATADVSIPACTFPVPWEKECLDSSGSADYLACVTWTSDQPLYHDLFRPHHSQVPDFPARPLHSSSFVQHGQGAPAFTAHQVGPLDTTTFPNPFYQPYFPEQVQFPEPSFACQRAPCSGVVMEESWAFEPEESGMMNNHVLHQQMLTLDATSLPCLESSGESDDGVLVERPGCIERHSFERQSPPPFDPAPQSIGKEKRSMRSRLTPIKRAQAASTRKIGACVRCKVQKISCVPNPEDPESSCCVTCSKVSLESKKVIHRLPCVRWRLSEVVMFRGDGLNLTKRWTGTAMKDLGPQDWVDRQPRTLIWQLDHTPKPLVFTVKQFRPQLGDSVTRKWLDANGNSRETWIAPFGLADIHKTAHEYMGYNYQYALGSLNMVKNDMIGHTDEIVCATYDEVSRRIVMAERPRGLPAKKVNPADFLHKYVKLWFGIRNSVGSAYITPGTDLLGMQPETHPDYPYGSKVSIPRMISEQFYNLQYERILVPYRKQVLEELNKMVTGKEPRHFYTVYLTIFMLLYETEVTCADRHRRAVQYSEPTYYSLPNFVMELQSSANILLLYWHYYKRDFNPLKTDWGNVKDKAPWSKLEPEQQSFLHYSWQYFADRNARPVEKLTWKDELYFVSQMFEDNWSVGATYMGS